MLVYCPECGSKLIRCENVAEHHDEMRCTKSGCTFVEPIDDKCSGGACSFYD